MRDYVTFYLNGEVQKISGLKCFETLANFLRYEKELTGTKIVCAEGDCGACTILMAREIEDQEIRFKSINSCIAPLYLLDGTHILTVEAFKHKKPEEKLHPIQDALAEKHGTQCGYCTPGFVCALGNMVEDLKCNKKNLSEKKVKNYLTGNLCRCTGYKGIIDAGISLDIEKIESLVTRYISAEKRSYLKECLKDEVVISSEQREIFLPTTIEKAMSRMSNEYSVQSGGTDLGVLVNKGKREIAKVISLINVPEMYEVSITDDYVDIGSRVTFDVIEKKLNEIFPEFTKKLHIFASPQIKNKGTFVGNIANGSPIGDSIPFALVSDAILTIKSLRGERLIEITKFYKGYKDFDISNDELITKIRLPRWNGVTKLYKVSARKDLDISAVTLATNLRVENGRIEDVKIAIGGVGPTVQRLNQIEKELKGKKIEQAVFQKASKDIRNLISPLSDLRGSKEFRLQLSENLMLKLYDDLKNEVKV